MHCLKNKNKLLIIIIIIIIKGKRIQNQKEILIWAKWLHGWRVLYWLGALLTIYHGAVSPCTWAMCGLDEYDTWPLMMVILLLRNRVIYREWIMTLQAWFGRLALRGWWNSSAGPCFILSASRSFITAMTKAVETYHIWCQRKSARIRLSSSFVFVNETIMHTRTHTHTHTHTHGENVLTIK